MTLTFDETAKYFCRYYSAVGKTPKEKLQNMFPGTLFLKTLLQNDSVPLNKDDLECLCLLPKFTKIQVHCTLDKFQECYSILTSELGLKIYKVFVYRRQQEDHFLGEVDATVYYIDFPKSVWNPSCFDQVQKDKLFFEEGFKVLEPKFDLSRHWSQKRKDEMVNYHVMFNVTDSVDPLILLNSNQNIACLLRDDNKWVTRPETKLEFELIHFWIIKNLF